LLVIKRHVQVAACRLNNTISLCGSSGSGAARKGAQHQSAVVGGRTYRSESLDRSHVSSKDVSRQQHRATGQDVSLLSRVSPNLSDSKRHTVAAESRLMALKPG